jgi:glutaconate CoA-transferase subunit A
VSDKRTSLAEAVGALADGMTVGIGGWGSRRKPMAAVRAMIRAGLRDLTVVSFGGPDVGLLCAAGCVTKVVYGFVTLDSVPLDPHFRAARQSGALAVSEVDEGMLYLGLLAAAQRLPFLPTRAGLGSDVLRHNPGIRTVRSPYPTPEAPDGEELVAMPALPLDAAFVHVNRADIHGNGQVLGPDPFFDDVLLGAASYRVVTAEEVVAPGALVEHGPLLSIVVNRLQTDAVVATPAGAHFTSCPPDYPRDEPFLLHYAASAEPGAWEAFAQRFVHVDDDEYRRSVASWHAEHPQARVDR